MLIVWVVQSIHRLGEIARGAIARFCGSLAALLFLAECALLRRRVLPGDRINAERGCCRFRRFTSTVTFLQAHSNPSKCRL